MRSLTPLLWIVLLWVGCRPLTTAPNRPTPLPPIQSQYLKGYQATYRTAGARLYRNGYHYLIERLPDHTYQYQAFHPEKEQLTLRCTYSDATLQQLVGPYESWWDNGLPKATGQYRAGKPDGEWRFYDPQTGLLYCIGHYRMGAPEGRWQYFDLRNDRPVASFHLANGQRNGPFELYDTLGQVAARGRYFLDALDHLQWQSDTPDSTLQARLDLDFRRMQGQLLTQAAAPLHCGDYTAMQRLECTQRALDNWIDRQLQIPAWVRQQRMDGQVTLALYVDETGLLTQIEAVSGLCAPLEDAIKVAFQGFPAAWVAAQGDSAPVTSVYYHTFSLESLAQQHSPRRAPLLNEPKRMR